MPDFKIPDRARQEIKDRPVQNEDAVLEFPAGSGVFAEYRAEERPMMRGLPRQEQEFIHLMKHTFHGFLVPDDANPYGRING